MLIQPISSLTPLGDGPASIRRVRVNVNLDEEISLAAAGNTDVGRCRVEEVGTNMTDMGRRTRRDCNRRRSRYN